MNILIELCHPAQFYYYRSTIANLQKDGHKVFVIIKSKDILEQLLINSGIHYKNILAKDNRFFKLGYFFDMVLREWKILIFSLLHNINLLTGSTPEISHIGWLLHKHSINIGEDDAAIIPKYVKICHPFIDTRLTPIVCNNGIMEKKAVKFDGFWKLAYLHPNVFTSSKNIVSKYFPIDKPYFLLRFVNLCAHHDTGIHGISVSLADKLVNLLSEYGCVYVSSEKELPDSLEKHRIHINPLDMHHILAFATLYIGDSQSMAVEAAMLGTPSLRFNDFAGKISVLEELEHKYGLTFGIPSNEPERLYSKIKELLAMPNLVEEFQFRRQRMLADKIDVTAFFTWFIENYPESRRIMQENPEYQYKFK